MKNFLLLSTFLFFISIDVHADVCLWFGGTDVWSDDTKWSCGHIPGPGDMVVIPSGSVEIDMPAHAGILNLKGGTIIGDGTDKLFAGSFIWEGGEVGPGAVIDITFGGSISIETPAAKILDGVLNNFGSASWTGGDILIGGEFHNFGEFAIAFDGFISGGGGIINEGIFHKTMGAGTATIVLSTIMNAATAAINVASGTLEITCFDIVNSGDLKAEFGHTLIIDSDLMMMAGADLPGTGTFKIRDGDIGFAVAITTDLILDLTPLTMVIDGLLTANAAVTISGGDFSGASGIVFKSTLDWEGGTLDVPISIEATSVLNLKGTEAKFMRNHLLLKGEANWTGGRFSISTATGKLKLDAGSTFNMKTTGPLDFEGGFAKGSIENDGVFNLDNAADGEIALPFNNDLELNVLDGILSLTDGLDHEGLISIADGEELQLFGTSEFKAFSSISGTGVLDFQAGTVTIDQAYDFVVGIDLSGATVTLNEDLITIGEVNVKAGTLTGTKTFTCNGHLNWEGGIIDVPVITSAISIITIGAAGNKTLKDNLTANGITQWNAGTIIIESPAIFDNTGTFNANASGSQTFSKITTEGTFKNSGTFINNNTTNNVIIDVNFTNTGLLKGVGVYDFNASFINSGKVAPGLSPGTLRIDGSYSNGSELDIELGNVGQDRLDVTETVSLSGHLKVTEFGSLDNGTYTILDCDGSPNCLSGLFSSVSFPSSRYTIIYGFDFVKIQKSSILAVDLVRFGVSKKHNTVELNWETSSEENNDYFLVERSVDGRRFQPIGEVKGEGFSESTLYYQFVDNTFHLKASTKFYYRLRQVDFDGQFSFSDIKMVNISNDTNDFVLEKVFQTNAQTITIQAFSNESQNVDFQIINMDGKLLQQHKTRLKKGMQMLELYDINFRTGVYILVARSEEHLFSKQFFIQN